MSTHLRSTTRPEFYRRQGGRIQVWTECGNLVDSIQVDNEYADCITCGLVEDGSIPQDPRDRR